MNNEDKEDMGMILGILLICIVAFLLAVWVGSGINNNIELKEKVEEAKQNKIEEQQKAIEKMQKDIEELKKE